MKPLFPYFAAPVALAALSVFVGCSSDNTPAPGNTAGSSPGGAAAAGSAGSGVAGAAVAGAPAGGAAAGGASGGSAGSVAGGGAGAGAGGGEPAVEASFATVKGIITMKCSSGAGCHTEPGNPLQMPNDANLYMKITTHVTEKCGMLVNKANPAQSALVKILQADCGTPPNVTQRMPFQSCAEGDTDVGPDAPCVSPANIAAIQAWITKGAPQQ